MITVNEIFRLGRDAEYKAVNEKGGFIKLWVVASDKQKQGDNWEDVPTWVSASMWRSNDKILQYLQKGTQVFLTGKLWLREHEGKSYLQMEVRDLKLIGSKQEQVQTTQQQAQTKHVVSSDVELEDLPF